MNTKNFTSRVSTLFLLAIVLTALGSYNASAAPQPLPFSFPVPALDDLEWQNITDDEEFVC